MKILSAIRKLLIRDAVADVSAGYTEYFKNDPDSASRVYSEMDDIFTVLTYGEVLNRASTQTGLADFSREGYVFKEWNTQPDGGGTSYHGGETISNGTTLYAIWVEKTDVVALNHEGAKILYDDLRGHIDEKVDLPGVYDYKSAVPADVVEIYDAVPEKIKQMQIEIAPVQDLHGYDKPWVGGAGKNLCQSSVKSEEAFGLNIVLNDDGSFKVTGTYNRNAAIDFYDSTKSFTLPAGTYTLSGTATNSLGIFLRVLSSSAVLVENAGNFTLSESTTVTVRMYVPASASGTALPTGGLIFYPMICLATETDATFEPYSNICPISGFTGCEVVRGGKNLFDNSVGTLGYLNSDGTIHSSTVWKYQYIKASPNTSYTFSGCYENIQAVHNCAFDKDFNWLSDLSIHANATITTPPNTAYIGTVAHISNDYNTYQVEKGSIATSYEPFGQHYTITFPDQAGTVYGGTLTVNADGTGTLVVDNGIVVITEWKDYDSTYKRFNTAPISNVKGIMARSTKCICDKANAIYDSRDISLVKNGDSYFGTATHQANHIAAFYIHNNQYTDVSEFAAAIGPVTVCYELYDKTIVELTVPQVRTILGYNRIYANTGSILSMLYPAERYQTAEQAEKERIHAVVDEPSAVMSVTDGADNVPMEMQIAIEPVQDTHGLTPYPPGGGKNKMSLSTISLNRDTQRRIWADIDQIPAGTYIVSWEYSGTSTNTSLIFRKNSSDDSDQKQIDVVTRTQTTITLNESYSAIYAFIAESQESGKTAKIDNIMVRLSTETDPTFAPYSNICPITGWTGANVNVAGFNVWDEAWEAGIYNPTTGQKQAGTQVRCKNLISVLPNTNYYFNGTTGCWALFYDASKNLISGYTMSGIDKITSGEAFNVANKVFATPSNAHYLAFYAHGTYGSAYKNDICINLSDPAKNGIYEPYSGRTYSITFPSSAGTVYGGTLTVNKDGTGTLVVDTKKYICSDNENIAYSATTGSFYHQSSTINPPAPTGSDLRKAFQGISDRFIPCDANMNEAAWISATDYLIGYVNPYQFRFKIPSAGTDVSVAKAILAGTEIVYKRNEPLVYTIPAPVIRSLLGANNVWADTGNVPRLEYSADTKLYVEDTEASRLMAQVDQKLDTKAPKDNPEFTGDVKVEGKVLASYDYYYEEGKQLARLEDGLSVILPDTVCTDSMILIKCNASTVTDEKIMRKFTNASSALTALASDGFDSSSELAIGITNYFAQIPHPESLYVTLYGYSENPVDVLKRAIEKNPEFYTVLLGGMETETNMKILDAYVNSLSRPYMLIFSITGTPASVAAGDGLMDTCKQRKSRHTMGIHINNMVRYSSAIGLLGILANAKRISASDVVGRKIVNFEQVTYDTGNVHTIKSVNCNVYLDGFEDGVVASGDRYIDVMYNDFMPDIIYSRGSKIKDEIDAIAVKRTIKVDGGMSVVDFEDGADNMPISLFTTIEHIQDLHGYDHPWAGGAGKNKINYMRSDTIDGIVFTYTQSTGAVSISGTASRIALEDLTANKANYQRLPAGNYKAVCVIDNTNIQLDVVVCYDNSTTEEYAVTSGTSIVSFTTTADAYIMTRFRCANGYAITGSITYYPMLMLATETNTTFEPYSNICPISGFAGCNVTRAGQDLFNESISATNNIVISSDGTETSNNAWETTNYIKVIPNVVYYIKAYSTNPEAGIRISKYGANKSFNERIVIDSNYVENTGYIYYGTFTTDLNCEFVRISLSKSLNSSAMADFDSLVFHARETYSITFPSGQTVYGGTLTVNADRTGTLIVDRINVDLGSLTWSKYTNSPNWLFQANILTSIKGAAQDTPSHLISSMYEMHNANNRSNLAVVMPDKRIAQAIDGTIVYVKDYNYTDAASFKSAMAGTQMIYELAVSQSYTFTVPQIRTILGYNRIYANTGNIMNLSYYKDSEIVADKNAKEIDAIGIKNAIESAEGVDVETINDGADGIPMVLTVGIEPVQDKHGYDNPWPAGAGQNIFAINQLTEQTINGVTFTPLADGRILINGTATARADYPTNTVQTFEAGSYTKRFYGNDGTSGITWATRIPSSGGMNFFGPNNFATATVTQDTNLTSWIQVDSGTVVNNQIVACAIYSGIYTESTVPPFTPYSNICPITGWTGAEITNTARNLYHGKHLYEKSYISSTGEVKSLNDMFVTEYIPVTSGENYNISFINEKTGFVQNVCGFNANHQFVQVVHGFGNASAGTLLNATVTIPSTVKYITMNTLYGDMNLQVIKGNEYIPFDDTTYSITFPSSAGTVYGGTLTVNKDGTGSLVVDKGKWVIDSNSTGATLNTVNGHEAVMYGLTGASLANYSENYKIDKFGTNNAKSDTDTVGSYCYNNSMRLRFPTEDVVTWITENGPITIIAPLATPITYTLPAPVIRSLLGANNLWADTGNVLHLDYTADTKSYIDNLFASLTNATGVSF